MSIMVLYTVRLRGLIMTGTSMLEMRLHDLSLKIAQLTARVERLEKELSDAKAH